MNRYLPIYLSTSIYLSIYIYLFIYIYLSMSICTASTVVVSIRGVVTVVRPRRLGSTKGARGHTALIRSSAPL